MGKSYLEMKVFELCGSVINRYTCMDVYACRGTAVDSIMKYEPWERKGMKVQEISILHTATQSLENKTELHRCVDAASGLTTSWFLTPNEAQAAARHLKFTPDFSFGGQTFYAAQIGVLNMTKIEPGPKTFQVEFEAGADGRLYARCNLHPELDGKLSKGKMIFPDKAFTTADIGPATVSVTKEFAGYAFVTGTMDRFEGPSLKEILDWAWDKQYDDKVLAIINHPSRGKYYAVKGEDRYSQVKKLSYDGKDIIFEDACYNPVVETDTEKHIEREVTFGQLFAEDVWGSNVNREEIANLFKPSKVFTTAYGCHWVLSQTYFGEAIKKAVELGALRQYREEKAGLEVIDVADADCGNFAGLFSFTMDEVRRLAAEVSTINAKADQKAEQYRAKGKICF